MDTAGFTLTGSPIPKRSLTLFALLLVSCAQIHSTPGSVLENGPTAWNDLRPLSELVHLGCVTLSPVVTRSDQAILRQLRGGDLQALEVLYRAYEGAIFNLGRRICGSDQGADDILQETFLEVSRSFRAFRGDGPLLGWIKKICVNKAVMQLRQNNRLGEESFEEVDDSYGDDPSVMIAAGHGQASKLEMEQAFEQLAPMTRTVVWLYDVEGYTHEEISRMLHKTVSFSKSQLSRAHARLRDWLASTDAGAPCDT
jgi:RNA polymerase sigma-70 factor (ECF subfamily)